jgi:predicted dienelactone hydrolase
MKLSVAVTTLAIFASGVSAQTVGLKLVEMDMPHHESTTEVAIWYPSVGGGEDTLFADNPVFQGVPATRQAEVAIGTYPIVLLSHGMGGGNESLAWLSAGLAEQGAVVLSLNHLNSTWRRFDMVEGVKHWTRALDLSLGLDALLEDPEFEGHLDGSRIMAAGFSFGGWTALSLGGLRGNHAGITDACQTFEDQMSACGIFLSEAVNLPGVDPAKWNASYSDARVTHVAAIDPGFVWGLESADVSGLITDVSMIGFGADADRMMDTNFDASGLAALLPEAKITRFAPAFHFTGMPLCKPAGEMILQEEQDDPVCTDPEGTDRAAVHDAVIALLVEQLGL